MPPRPSRQASTVARASFAAQIALDASDDDDNSPSGPKRVVLARRPARAADSDSDEHAPSVSEAEEDDSDDISMVSEQEDEVKAAPSPKVSRAKKAARATPTSRPSSAASSVNDQVSDASTSLKTPGSSASPTTQPVAARKKRTPPDELNADGKSMLDGDSEPVKKKRATKKATAAKVIDYELGIDGEPILGSDGEKRVLLPPKKSRKKVKEVVIYDVPDVAKLETTFKGRLGYACLNSLLREQDPPVFCSRTLRLASLHAPDGPQRLSDLTEQNTLDLITILKWNADNGIYLFRLSSEMFPFASHPQFGYSLKKLPLAMANLAKAGEFAREHNMRITVHPGQWTQLASPRESVYENAVLDLVYHCEMLDAMNVGPDGVINIHMGGAYGDKALTLERFKTNYAKLPDNVKARLVLENDEICYSVEELLPVCEELGIPLTLDYHHDWINPSSLSPPELMPRILATWSNKGIRCKQHLSEVRPGAVTVSERRGHSDRCARLPVALGKVEGTTEEERKRMEEADPVEGGLRMGLPDDVDLMIEAKDKEQAVLHLYNVYSIAPIHRGSYLPPKPPTAPEEPEEGEDAGAVEVDENGVPIAKKELTPMAKIKRAKAKAKQLAQKRKVAKEREKEEEEEQQGLTLSEGEGKGETPVKKKKATPKKVAAKQEMKGPIECAEEAVANGTLGTPLSKKRKSVAAKEGEMETSSPPPAKKQRLTQEKKLKAKQAAREAEEAKLAVKEEMVDSELSDLGE